MVELFALMIFRISLQNLLGSPRHCKDYAFISLDFARFTALFASL